MGRASIEVLYRLDQVSKKLAPPAEPIASGNLEGVDEFPVINMPSEFIVNVHGDGYRPKVSGPEATMGY